MVVEDEVEGIAQETKDFAQKEVVDVQEKAQNQDVIQISNQIMVGHQDLDVTDDVRFLLLILRQI